MTTLRELAVFGLISLAAYLVGRGFQRVRLPAITGYLFTGAIAGPFVLGLLPESASVNLRFVDEISLAVIAMVAGGELLLRQLRSRLRTIGVTVASVVVTGFLTLTLVIYLLAPHISFTAGFGQGQRLALALLGAAVLLALSPPSVIAVIKEVNARGRFTRTILGVTVTMDVVVIVLFAAMTSLASPLLVGDTLDFGFLGVLLVDLTSAVAIGVAFAWLLSLLLASRASPIVKIGVILGLGFGVYELADFIKTWSVETIGFEVYIEPLLISLIAGLLVVNFTRHREQFDGLLHQVGPLVYVVFFTVTGLSLKLDLLLAVLPIAMALFVVRIVGVGAGAIGGGLVAGEPKKHRRVSWMVYITQAGIALGLAREVAVQFPQLGDAFATLIVSVVVLNEVAGPLFLKAALRRVGEAHEPGAKVDNGGRVLVFGIEGQSIELAQSLELQGQSVTLVQKGVDDLESPYEVLETLSVDGLDEATLDALFTDDVSAVVAMLEDDTDNEAVISFAAERRGISRLVVRPASLANRSRYQEMDAVVVHPTTAILSLLVQGVLTPDATTLLFDHAHGREMLQVRVTNPAIDGLSVKDLRLPPGVLLLEIRRAQSVVLVDGHTKLRLGDEVTLITAEESQSELRVLLG